MLKRRRFLDYSVLKDFLYTELGYQCLHTQSYSSQKSWMIIAGVTEIQNHWWIIGMPDGNSTDSLSILPMNKCGFNRCWWWLNVNDLQDISIKELSPEIEAINYFLAFLKALCRQVWTKRVSIIDLRNTTQLFCYIQMNTYTVKTAQVHLHENAGTYTWAPRVLFTSQMSQM